MARLPSVPFAIFLTRRGCDLQPLYCSFHPFQQKLQKQLLQLLIAAHHFQIRRKHFTIKRDFPGRGGEPLVGCVSGFPPSLENSLPVCDRGRASTSDVLHGSLINLIALNTAYFHKRLLGVHVIVGNEIGAGQVQLFGRILYDIAQFRDKPCQLDRLADFILGDAEELRHQGPRRILRLIFA